MDNHYGVIKNLEPDILEGEVKWALGNVTTNKPCAGNGISVELFQILKGASYPPPPEGRQTENHNHRKLTNLITWTTALSNTMKL